MESDKNPEYYPKWPKRIPDMTPEQIEIKNDFMKYWHEVLPKKYGMIEAFNHKFVVSRLDKPSISNSYSSGG